MRRTKSALLRAASRRGAFTWAKNISQIGNSERCTVSAPYKKAQHKMPGDTHPYQNDTKGARQ